MNNAFNIPQRVLILGASSDIATETALALAANGARAYVWSQPGHVDLALVAFGSLTGETDTVTKLAIASRTSNAEAI